jgi:histone H3/H4
MADKEQLIVGSKVKNYIKEKDMMSSSDMLDSLNEAVHELLDKAAERAQANNRKTVQAKDI